MRSRIALLVVLDAGHTRESRELVPGYGNRAARKHSHLIFAGAREPERRPHTDRFAE